MSGGEGGRATLQQTFVRYGKVAIILHATLSVATTGGESSNHCPACIPAATVALSGSRTRLGGRIAVPTCSAYVQASAGILSSKTSCTSGPGQLPLPLAICSLNLLI